VVVADVHSWSAPGVELGYNSLATHVARVGVQEESE
jgi:hypothetical protein